MNRPITTLFMLESLDGKISTGNSDNLDADKDFPKIDGVKEGLNQYYEIECTTDYFSLNTGRVMAKIGVNDKKEYHDKVDVNFVIIDNKPHLNENGIDYICHWVEKLILVTTNKNIINKDLYHPNNVFIIGNVHQRIRENYGTKMMDIIQEIDKKFYKVYKKKGI